MCGELIKFEEEDKDNYIFCSSEGCKQKIHISCLEQDICDKCRVWACADHLEKYIICDRCGILHDACCINHLGGNSALDKEEDVCNNCLYKD